MTRIDGAPPPFTPGREAAEFAADLSTAYERVVSSGNYLLGPELESLEDELAQYSGRRNVVGVGSGTDALIIAMKALDLGPEDEVIVPGLTAVPTVSAVLIAGAKPVLADVEPDTGCLSVSTISAALTPATAAIVVVHLYGYPVPIAEIRRLAKSHSLALIEDLAQAFGATGEDGGMVGGAGIAGCASFYPTKVLSSLGDGGAILTDDDDLASKARLLRSHGHLGGYRHSVVAGNSRLDELQSAFLRAKLTRIDDLLERRRAVAAALRAGIELVGDPGLTLQADALGHVYQVLAARHPDRDNLVGRLSERGANLIVHYPLAIAEQEAFAGKGFDPALTPESVRWAREEFSLPTAAQIDRRETECLVELLKEELEAGR